MSKNKRILLIAIIGGVVFFTINGLMFYKIYQNHQLNNEIIDECFENFDEVGGVVLEKKGLLSQVSCENS